MRDETTTGLGGGGRRKKTKADGAGRCVWGGRGGRGQGRDRDGVGRGWWRRDRYGGRESHTHTHTHLVYSTDAIYLCFWGKAIFVVII